MRIGIDLLGSDTPPSELFPAVLLAAEAASPARTLVVFTTKDAGEDFLSSHTQLKKLQKAKQIEFRYVKEFIAMADDPLVSIRKKKSSSMTAGIRLLKKKQLNAFVTAGNTGALIAGAALTLPMMPGIKRPALLAVMPTQREPLTVIDVGGNVTCKAPQLVQFARLGAAYHCCSQGKKRARVGLLNIGIESKKGTSEIRQTYKLLQEMCAHGKAPHIDFIGNVEGRDLFAGTVDVLVTDGFTGNVVLKTSEGMSAFVFDYIRRNLKGSSQPHLKTALSELQALFNYAEHPGAIVCGAEALLIKCHGNATAASLYTAIQGAIDLVERDLIRCMKHLL